MESSKEFSQLEQFLLKHAGLVALDTNTEKICLQGPVKIKNKWYNVKLNCPHFPKASDIELHVQQNFNIKIFNHKNCEINENWSVECLLENLPNLMSFDGPSLHMQSINVNHDGVPNIYEDVIKVFDPKEYKVELNELYSRIRFSNFSQNEQHYLDLELPSLQVLQHRLPTCIDWQEVFGKATTLPALILTFRKVLDDLRPFYDNFTDIDELCYVVQPSLPTTKENWRLFVLKENIFLKLQFSDPFSPLGSMLLHIIGPTAEVSHLRRVYSEGLKDWDGELDVHKNLMRIFDLCFFPMQPAEGEEESMQFCNICYSYKLEKGDIPIISCDNPSCSLIFHAECLKEWFGTLADGKTFLDVAFGVCPFCKAKLSTSFEEILK